MINKKQAELIADYLFYLSSDVRTGKEENIRKVVSLLPVVQKGLEEALREVQP